MSGARPTGQSPGSGPASTSGRPPASVEEETSLLARITAPFKELAMRGTVYTSFVFAKQPKRIRQARAPFESVSCLQRAAGLPLLRPLLCSVLWAEQQGSDRLVVPYLKCA